MLFNRFAIPFLILGLGLVACKKSDSQAPANPTAEKMADLKVAEDFNWSAALHGSLIVDFENPHNISLDREYLHLRAADGQTLAKTQIVGTRASFAVDLPANGNFEVYFPYNQQSLPINGPGTYTFTASLPTNNKRGKLSSGGSCTVCASPIENNLAELPVIPDRSYRIVSENTVPGWETTAPDGKIEIWSSGFNGVPAHEGRQFFEINANFYPNAALFQTLCLEPNSTIRWSVYHRGRAGVDVARVRIGASVSTATEQAIMTTGNTQWAYYSGTYHVPAGQTSTVFVFEAVSTASGNSSVGNFLDNFRIDCDEDGDGVPDFDDDFPQDPSRTFASTFPSAGKQILSFEDLWPSMGDFDFNDLVLTQQAEISRVNDELVRADFKVSVDAIGAGLRNGIGLLLRNNEGTRLSGDLVSSVSGDISYDPDNENGFILTNDIFASISTYYQNNGFGPSKTPDTLRFTLNFKPGYAGSLYPELYLFRTNDRGLEIHRPGFEGSSAFDASRHNTKDDAGDFKTAHGLPWAIEIVSSTSYQHPKEKVDMLDAFPQFAAWATSGGDQNQTWYNFPNQLEVYNPGN